MKVYFILRHFEIEITWLFHFEKDIFLECRKMYVQNVFLLTAATDISTGKVGAPLQCNEIKLRDWLEGRLFMYVDLRTSVDDLRTGEAATR